MTNIADKIAKIIAKADSTTNEEEAETFMAKAHELMTKHGLDLLAVGKLNSDDPLGRTQDAASASASYSWAAMMGSQLARYYGCRVVLTGTRKTNTFDVFGRESARVTFQLMFPYVYRQVMKVARELHKEGKFPTGGKARTAVGNALALRLHRMAKEQEGAREAAPKSSGLNELVPVDLIENMMVEAYPNLRSARSRSVKTNAAATEAAGRINVNRQMGGGSATRQIGSR